MFKQFTHLKQRGLNLAEAHRAAFSPCEPTAALSIGFVAHADGSAALAGVELLTIERKSVPSDVVKREAAKRCDKIEQETGRRPKGKHLMDIKAEVERELLVKAFPKRKTVPVLWLDEFVLIGSTTAADVDAVTSILSSSDAGLILGNLATRTTPSVAMTTWAREPAAEDTPFAIGQDLTVLLSSGGKATFKDAAVYSTDVREALAGASVVTSLALATHHDVAFVLTEHLVVKSLRVGGTIDGDHANPSAAECHLFRGELQRLMSELLEALGGLLPAEAESRHAA